MASRRSAAKAAWFVIGFLTALACVATAVAMTSSLPTVAEAVGWGRDDGCGRYARQAALISDLQTVRSQIELYRVQHGERGPERDGDGRLDTPGFVARLMQRTDVHGNLAANGRYGPYLLKFPTNPFASMRHDTVAFGTGPPGDGTSGWYFDTGTGVFSANDSTVNAQK